MSGATSYNTCTCVIAGGSGQSQNTGQLYADQCFDNMARVNSPHASRPADVPDVWQLKVYAQTKRENGWVEYFSVIILSTFKENMSV